MNGTVSDSPILVLTAQWILPVAQAPIENGYIRIDGERIVALGAIHDLPATEREQLPIPKPGSLLTPGLVNCHAHLEQFFDAPIRKTPEQPFTDWLLSVVRQLQQQASPEQKRERCVFGTQELLRTGTTCVNDIASGPESLQVLEKYGLRGIVSLEVFHPGHKTVNIAHWIDAYQRFSQEKPHHSKLHVGLSPHSPYNVAPAAWQALLDTGQPSLIHTHLAEFEDEVYYLQGKPSQISHLHQTILGRTFTAQQPANSPVEYLSRFQLLNPHTLVAHAIHTTPEDRQHLAEAGVTVAHCPRSNLALHGQTLKAAEWQDFAIPMGLGTDGRLSTPDLDLRAEARCAMSVHGWTARQALEAMTLNGACALHLEAEIGTLVPGKQADIVLWQAASAVSDSAEEHLMQENTQAMAVFIAGQCRWQRFP